jgi:hypothetical protein
MARALLRELSHGLQRRVVKKRAKPGFEAGEIALMKQIRGGSRPSRCEQKRKEGGFQ